MEIESHQQLPINALHRCGLSVCYPSVLDNLGDLADHCIKLAVEVGSGIHVSCYDNVQISTSIFVEQRGSSRPGKSTSGTVGLLCKVRNGDPDHMRLAPILERFKLVKGLEFNRDIRPTHQQHKSFHIQLKVAVIRVLLEYCPSFQSYATDPALQNLPRRPMPPNYITEQFPLRATTIEKATVNGNLFYHDDVYINRLGRTHEDLCRYAIPRIDDQLTNSGILSGQILRARDLNPLNLGCFISVLIFCGLCYMCIVDRLNRLEALRTFLLSLRRLVLGTNILTIIPYFQLLCRS